MATAIKNAVQNVLSHGDKTNGHSNGTNSSAKRPIKIAGCSGGKLLFTYNIISKLMFDFQVSTIESAQSTTWQRTKTSM